MSREALDAVRGDFVEDRVHFRFSEIRRWTNHFWICGMQLCRVKGIAIVASAPRLNWIASRMPVNMPPKCAALAMLPIGNAITQQRQYRRKDQQCPGAQRQRQNEEQKQGQLAFRKQNGECRDKPERACRGAHHRAAKMMRPNPAGERTAKSPPMTPLTRNRVRNF